MKVVINNCYGGFSVSLEGCHWMAERGHEEAKKQVAEHEEELRVFEFYKKHRHLPSEAGDDHMRKYRASMFDISIKYNKPPDFYSSSDFERHDPLLVACVEALGGERGKGASGDHAKLKVVEIPDGTEYEIAEYDGNEWVAEKHEKWS